MDYSKVAEFCKKVEELEREYLLYIGSNEEGIYIEDVRTKQRSDWLAAEQPINHTK